jgi:hypothetical protein
MPWRQIAGPVSSVYAGGAGVIAGDPNGVLFQFDGTNWLEVGAPYDAVYIADDYIFMLSSPFSASLKPIMTLDPTTHQLTAFQPPASAYWMCVGDGYYYTTLSDVPGQMGDIYTYQLSLSTGATWTQIGGPAWQFVVGGANLYAISTDGQAVLTFSGEGQWIGIGGPPSGAIFAGNAGLVSRGLDSNTYLFNNNGWTNIGRVVPSYTAVNENSIFQSAVDGSGVFQFTGFPGIWSKIGNSFLNVFGYPSKRPSFINYPCVFGLSNPDSNLWLWELKASISCVYDNVVNLMFISGNGFTVGGMVEIYSYEPGQADPNYQPFFLTSLVSSNGTFSWDGPYNIDLGLYFYAIDVATGDVASGVA